MPLFIQRITQNESWREAVERIASKHGLQEECLEIFESFD